MATYERLIEAELLLADAARRRGVGEDAIAAAAAGSEPDAAEFEADEDVLLTALARYVTALGGHLEVQAVFPEETVTVLRAPGGETPPDSA